ncbi:MAG: ParB N-terminal domain-containing protein, partial [Ruminococcus sp.]|nr:ParB N-terminal domain-containing protein [Ruminococcus sp.]
MQQTVESIRGYGVLVPAIARPREDGGYELIAGHRRKHACELAGLTTLRSEIKDLTRDEAIMYMVESNFQRTTILPSEKAFAYKMRLEAMNRQGKRSDLTSDPLGGKYAGKESAEIVGRDNGDSQTQVRRYIRLTNLIPELLELVDEGKIKMRPAVELSYLSEAEQYDVLHEIEVNDCTPSHDQTIRMRKLSEKGELETEAITAIMTELKPNQQERIVLKADRVRKLIPDSVPLNKTEEYICKAIEHYSKYLKNRLERGR